MESVIHFSTYQTQTVKLDTASAPTAISGDSKMSKKHFHNASERDRRKKTNGFYSTLRSLLPGVDEMVCIYIYIYVPINRIPSLLYLLISYLFAIFLPFRDYFDVVNRRS